MFAILPSKPSTYFFVINLASACFARLDGDQAIERAASDLAGGKALGWFQGRMEFGPRALCNIPSSWMHVMARRWRFCDIGVQQHMGAVDVKLEPHGRTSFEPVLPLAGRTARVPSLFGCA